MKVIVTKDFAGVIVWKMDAEPVFRKPSGFGVAQWYGSKYWFDFNARIFGYSQTEKMFPELLDMQDGTCKTMELTINKLPND